MIIKFVMYEIFNFWTLFLNFYLVYLIICAIFLSYAVCLYQFLLILLIIKKISIGFHNVWNFM